LKDDEEPGLIYFFTRLSAEGTSQGKSYLDEFTINIEYIKKGRSINFRGNSSGF